MTKTPEAIQAMGREEILSYCNDLGITIKPRTPLHVIKNKVVKHLKTEAKEAIDQAQKAIESNQTSTESGTDTSTEQASQPSQDRIESQSISAPVSTDNQMLSGLNMLAQAMASQMQAQQKTNELLGKLVEAQEEANKAPMTMEEAITKPIEYIKKYKVGQIVRDVTGHESMDRRPQVDDYMDTFEDAKAYGDKHYGPGNYKIGEKRVAVEGKPQ